MTPRRFPPPWTVEETDACFVASATPPGRHSPTSTSRMSPAGAPQRTCLTRDEARRRQGRQAAKAVKARRAKIDAYRQEKIMQLSPDSSRPLQQRIVIPMVATRGIGEVLTGRLFGLTPLGWSRPQLVDGGLAAGTQLVQERVTADINAFIGSLLPDFL
jgi:hypothetical protein